MAYTEDEILDSLRVHCIDEHLSKYTKHKPTWQAYLKRMKNDEEFTTKVNELLCEADQWFERQGLAALHDKDFNNVMFAKLTNNKAFTRDHLDAEMLERIEALEDAKNTKAN